MTKRREKKHLRYVGLQPRTLRAYRLALESFLRHLKKNDVSQLRVSKLDHQLSEFINSSFQEGGPISYSGHLLSALKRFHPELKLKLPVSTQFYRNWARSYTPKRAVPASWPLVEAMIAVALSRRQPSAGLLLALGFNCMLRTSEMLGLTFQHILLHQGSDSLSIVLPHAKTSDGNPQVLQVTDPGILALSRQLLSSLSRRQRRLLLWPLGPHAFRGFFQELLTTLGFPADSYLPYSLRRGGATFHYQATLSLDSTVTRGRWSCIKTARLYVNEGTAQLASLSWTSQQVRRVRQWRLKGLRLRQVVKKRS